MSVIVPGDAFPNLEAEAVTIGPGVYKSPKTQSIAPSVAGFLRETPLKNNEKLLYIDSNTKRYIPQTGDHVLGVVVGVYLDFFKVSLQAHLPGVQLSMMAFPNASKKNRPNLKVGLVVYARVSEAVPEIVTEIECLDPETGKDGGFGPLAADGYLFDVNMNFARELLYNKKSVFLEKLAAKVPFEIAIGINGRIWLKCGLLEEAAENDMETDEPLPLKQLRLTLAASRYLAQCQTASSAEADAILKTALKGAL